MQENKLSYNPKNQCNSVDNPNNMSVNISVDHDCSNIMQDLNENGIENLNLSNQLDSSRNAEEAFLDVFEKPHSHGELRKSNTENIQNGM